MGMKVGLIMGSDSDWPLLENGVQVLERFEIDYEVRVLSAHRTPNAAAEFAQTAEEKGIEVIIAAAGMSAHLAGVMAAHTSLPVIGIPINNGAMNGLDALLSTVMMPPGVPVACVGIDAGLNAALLATQMLSIKYPELRVAFSQYKKDMEQSVKEKEARLQQKRINRENDQSSN